MNSIWKNLRDKIRSKEAVKQCREDEFIAHMESIPLDTFRKLFADKLEKEMNPVSYINIMNIIHQFSYQEAFKFGVYGGCWCFWPTAKKILEELSEVFLVVHYRNFEYKVTYNG